MIASTSPTEFTLTDTRIGQYLQFLALIITRYLLPPIAFTYVVGEFVGRWFFTVARPFYVRTVRPALTYAFTLN